MGSTVLPNCAQALIIRTFELAVWVFVRACVRVCVRACVCVCVRSRARVMPMF